MLKFSFLQSYYLHFSLTMGNLRYNIGYFSRGKAVVIGNLYDDFLINTSFFEFDSF